MAKIKPAGGKKGPRGPKHPGAVGCLVLLAGIAVVVGVVLYYSFART
jgi:hypothetical protein